MSNGSEGSVYRPVVLAPWNLQSRLASPQPLCWLLWSTQERALCDVTIVFGAAALSASHLPLPPRCGDEIFDASSLRLDIPANS